MHPRQSFRLLCVDDNPAVLEMLATAFTTFGYEVDTARNGYGALRKVNANPAGTGLIMTDLRMPGMSGISLIEESRAAGYAGPFIVYAAMISPDDRNRLRELRVHTVIDKPARAGELLAAVRAAQSGG